ncbi:MAG: MBL fold metallo-hydrolase [Candidatus Helarchaeota archaeon]
MASYLIVGKKKKVLIDASGKSEGRRIAKKVLKLGFKPDILIITHSHWDHAGGISSIIKKIPDIEIMVHEAGAGALSDPNDFNKWFSDYTPQLEPITEINRLKDGEIIDIGDIELEIISTPGHTNCSICIFDRKNKTLFTGDSLGYMLTEKVFFGPIMPPQFSEKKLLKTFEKVEKIEYTNICLAHFGCLSGKLATTLPEFAKSNYYKWKNFFISKWNEKQDPIFIESELKNELTNLELQEEMAIEVSKMFADWILKGLKSSEII